MKRKEFLYMLSACPLWGYQQAPPAPSKDRNIRVKTVEADTRAPALGLATGRRRALCLGNNAYRLVPTLRNATRDAADVAAALKKYHFETMLSSEAPLAEMRAAI